MLVVLDPGHGGRDVGAVGRRGTTEKSVTLQVGLYLEHMLKRSGIDVALTRSRDEFVPLDRRVNVAAEAGAHVFVSIHCNSSFFLRVSGIESFYFYGSRQGRRLASALQRCLVLKLARTDRGVKEAGFYVLRETLAPAALVELGFLSNPVDEKLLSDPSFRRLAAEALYQGIVEYGGWAIQSTKMGSPEHSTFEGECI